MERKPCGPPFFFFIQTLIIILFCVSHVKSCFLAILLMVCPSLVLFMVKRLIGSCWVVSHNFCIKVTWLWATKGLVLFITPYSCFEEGCRKKWTRQSRKVLWVVLSSLFFKEIWKNGTRGHGPCLKVPKESNKTKFDSYSFRNSVLIISHITFRDCRVHIFLWQPFSK